MLINNALQNTFFHTTLGCNKPCRNDNGTLSVWFQRIKYMLNKASVNSHFGFCRINFLHCIGHTSPKADGVRCQRFAELGKVKFERRIAHDEIKFLQCAVILLVRRLGERITLHHVLQRRGKVIENEIQAEHFTRFFWNILAIDGATFLTNLVCQSHQQCTCTCRWVVASDSTKFRIITNKQTCHHLCYSTWRIVFSIFSATSIVESFQQMLENAWEEIVLFTEHIFKIERSHIAHQWTGKLIAFLRIGNIVGDGVENIYFVLARSWHREVASIEVGNVHQRLVK